MKVSILLATYNGEKYLREQIDSLLNQTYQDFYLYISDDMSSDNTVSIIKEYVASYPKKIFFLKKEKPSGCAQGNFFYLLNNVQSDLYLFCDQDDVWTNEHVEIFVKKYVSLSEKEKNIPILIHSDLTVVDSKLKIIHKSFLKRLGLPKEPLKRFYYQKNNVTGCVMAINEQLKKIALHDYNLLISNLSNIKMHDHFFGLVSVIFGKKYFIDKSTNFYRQHENNVCGVDLKKRSIFDKILDIISFKKNSRKASLYIPKLNKIKNEIAFYISYFNNFDDFTKEKKVMTEFLNLPKKNKLYRILFLIRYGLFDVGVYRNLILFYII